MEKSTVYPCAARWVSPTRRLLSLILMGALLVLGTEVRAQLSGSKTVGGTGADYATIQAAIAALSGGVSGPVTFRINGGTYTVPSGGWTLTAVTGMSATNTVTFKPAANATVVLSGNTGQYTRSAVFNFNGGKNFIIDGSNSTGGTSRDMTIRQTETLYNATIWFKNDADKNVIKNCNLEGSAQNESSYYGGGIVVIGESSQSAGCDSNIIQNNVIGDPNGTYRNHSGVWLYGSSSGPNDGNRILSNDIVNFGSVNYRAMGIYHYYYNRGTTISGNLIHNTSTGSGNYYTYGMYIYDFNTSTAAAQNITVEGNRMYKLLAAPTIDYAYVYGIYFYIQNSSSVSHIRNNMITMNEDGPFYLYGTYIQSSAGTVNVHNNSTYAGGVGDGPYTMRLFYKTSAATINHRNNIYHSTRTGTTSTNYGLYISNTANWTSNYNLINVNTGSLFYTAYYSGSRLTLADFRTASGQEVNSIGGIPQFVDIPSGDLHVSTTKKTPVEGRGTPIATVTGDFDGNTRSATTPDIGSDEGTFAAPIADDMGSVRLGFPTDGRFVRSNSAFVPTGVVYNAGTVSRSAVTVRYRIWRPSTGTLVYNDTKTTGSLPAFESQTITFSSSGTVSGSTSLTPGTYVIELRTELAGDGDTTNNALYGTITVKDPLCGTYTINKNGTGVRNYTSFTAAALDLNSVGVSCATTFEVAAGTYDGTTETFPLVFTAIPSGSSTNTVTFKPASGAQVVLQGDISAAPMMELNQTDYVTFDGSNSTNGTSRDWKFRNIGTSPLIRLKNGATYNTFKNTYMVGASTSISTALINIRNSSSTFGIGNSYNVFRANTIGDSTAASRAHTALYSYGDYSYPNTANRIEDNDVINFGKNYDGYGIFYDYYNSGVKIVGNRIRFTSTTGTDNMGSVTGIYHYNYYNGNDSILSNRIWNIRPNVGWGPTVWGMYLYSGSASPLVVANNMIHIDGNGGYLYGFYTNGGYGAVQKFDHNTVHLGGSPMYEWEESAALYLNYNEASVSATNNIFTNERTLSSAYASNFALYIFPMGYGPFSSDNNLLYANGSGAAIVGTFDDIVDYIPISYATTLGDWQSMSDNDQNSLNARAPFVSKSTGDLHIDPKPVFVGESRAEPSGYTHDVDMNPRDAVAPDLGADEGDFNGGGLALLYPNGGEQLTVGYQLTVQYTANRPMGVRIELSTNGGASWTSYGTVNPTNIGANSFTLTTPDTVTSQARLRVISLRNQWEADTTDQSFNLVRPIITLSSPNGGERWVPTDTMQVRWTSQFVPATMRLQIDYSTNAGSTWLPVATNVSSPNLPTNNAYNWIVPNTPTQQALVRVKIVGSPIGDVSQSVFTIAPQPSVQVTTPNGGERLYVGDKYAVQWTAVTTDYVDIFYSVDGGSTWVNAVPNNAKVPGYIGRYEWVIPDAPSTTALVRLVDHDRPRFADVSNAPFSILKGSMQVTAPNGGEKYELSEQVTATWLAPASLTVRLDYSFNGGKTWQTVQSGIPASLGTFTFTPPAVPTRSGVIRVVDGEREQLVDMSDGPFEIMEAPSITVYTPSQGEQIVRGSVYPITWGANRIDRVTIELSMNGGSSWTTIVANIPATPGNFNTWGVPSTTTNQAKIRIREVGGDVVGESGLFSIVEPKNPSVRVLEPNGGESFTEGDQITIRWTSNDVTKVTVRYSSNGGTTWGLVASNISAALGEVMWTAPGVPGTEYRVSVVGSSTALDESDANFTIARRMQPALTLIYPNGGENLKVGSTVPVRWSATDIAGDVTLMYSVDNGTSWLPMGNATAAAGTYDWQVPDAPTTTALVRIEGGGMNDRSDAAFEISHELVAQIRVLSPNGGEEWRGGEMHDIEWVAQQIDNVKIHYSTDGGVNWSEIAPSVPAAAGKYGWTVPITAVNYDALVKVSTLDDAVTDRSDATFRLLRPASGIADAAVTGAGLRLLGNFPNPFASRTEIRWMQPTSSSVVLRVFEQSGRMVEELRLGHRDAGVQRVDLNAGTLPSGIYVYELRVGTTAARGMMMIAR